MPKIVEALRWRKRLDELADELQQCLYGACRPLAQRRLQLRESHLDRIEVGRVGWQIPHLGADGLDRLARTFNLVGAQVVHEHGVAFAQRRREDLLDIGEERWPVHRAVDDIGRSEAIDAQGSNERQRLPVAVRDIRDETLAAR